MWMDDERTGTCVARQEGLGDFETRVHHERISVLASRPEVRAIVGGPQIMVCAVRWWRVASLNVRTLVAWSA